ncbi:MAG: hypothetical protein LQ348_006884 [Seirophora lacunosa]|nr:MAG: hypothetical protein LQ348_006884 [Seirophora lacunosa]
MANGHSNPTIFGPDLSLTSDQQNLLRTALSSNNHDFSFMPGTTDSNTRLNGTGSEVRNGSTQHNSSPQGTSMYQSPTQATMSPLVDSFPLDDSPFVDGQDLDDANFDWDDGGDQLFGDLPGASGHEDDDIHDKRKDHPEDENEDGKSKRHEGNEKNNKKPGRKPLNSSEPTTKRKAQNRAAQRAFRERKERHLKDLETKVEDLEKASEATNHENGRLRATVERLTTEVKEYRKRLSLNSTGYSPPTALAPQLNQNLSGNNDFQFAFPKFGDLPGSTFMSNGSIAKIGTPSRVPSRTPSGNIPGVVRAGSARSSSEKSPATSTVSPTGQNRKLSPGSSMRGGMQASPTSLQGNGLGDLSELFSPSILASASRSNSSDYMFPIIDKAVLPGTKQSSAESSGASNGGSNKHRASSTSITASPSVSSVSHVGMDSSCGTTPEPSADSPEHRKPTDGTLNTINEESAPHKSVNDRNSFCDEWATACGNTMNPVPLSMSHGNGVSASPSSAVQPTASNVNGIDMMARQNGGTFDPVLFSDYRDPQNDLFNNDFFNEAFLNQDFSTPFNMPEDITPSPKKDLMQQVEAQQNSGDKEVVPGEDPKQYLTCEKLWDRVQQSEKAQSGEVDMDNLCSQLKAKAKCSGSGAVIEQKDVDAILGPPPDEQKDFLKMFK